MLQKNFEEAFWSVIKADSKDNRKNLLVEEFEGTLDAHKILS